MSNPQVVFFDTGPLISLFSNNSSEQKIITDVYEHLEQYPHVSKHVVGATMVELFYKLRKARVRPEAAKKNLDSLGIELIPTLPAMESAIMNAYCSFSYSVDFDYADFYMCFLALQFKSAHILTVDNDDMGNALSKAYSAQTGSAASEVRLITFSH